MSRDDDKSIRKSRHSGGVPREEKMHVAMASTNGYDDARSVTYSYQAPYARRGWHARAAQKLERWSFLYNVTTGLYMLDWWERCLFNSVFLVFLLVACYNSGHYISKFGAGVLAWCGDDSASQPFGGQHLRTVFGVLGELGGGGARG